MVHMKQTTLYILINTFKYWKVRMVRPFVWLLQKTAGQVVDVSHVTLALQHVKLSIVHIASYQVYVSCNGIIQI